MEFFSILNDEIKSNDFKTAIKEIVSAINIYTIKQDVCSVGMYYIFRVIATLSLISRGDFFC